MWRKNCTFAKEKKILQGEGGIELHYPGYNFLGPNTNINKLLKGLNSKYWSRPVDLDDKIACRHDLCYAHHRDRKLEHASRIK